MYAIVVALAALSHFAFLGYLVGGGFIALRWRRTFWLHGAVVSWGMVTTIAHLDCPLTGLERWARARAGMAPLPPQGFIAHYITGVLYPASWVGTVQAGAFATVTVSWALYFWRGGWRPHVRRRCTTRRPHEQ
ncbi:DUF2784 domain-containing protein [Mycobacterium sp. SM1]|uniref:DUF2784 domain-containing protein n=1 Tax=Mycobacterium sp. SM1 TaxID=2816243 RepID=UPI001BD0E9CD|nr:DUF2784 domain-containing protein [Mycobacterium sp. SM1]MBS4730480.1 DUF2784 domain-containing protein [Mycobacterium sp. SM1]